MRRNESASPKAPQGGNSSASSSTCTPNERGKKFINLSEIYEQETTNEGMNSLFALYWHVDDPVHSEEAEAKIEVEETVQQMLKEEAAIQIRTKAKATTNKVDNIMLKDKGMKNPMSNVTTVKNMGIMQMNVGRNNMI